MDFNPLIPNATSHDIAHVISESFEDTMKSYILPSDISENLRKNNVDKEYAAFQQFGYEVKQFADIATEKHEGLQALEMNLMMKHGLDIILEKDIEEDTRKKDRILLKRDGFFSTYQFNVKDMNLIDKNDILPNTIERSLEFVYKKDLHGCKSKHCEEIERKDEEQPSKLAVIKSRTSGMKKEQKEECINESMRLEPTEILFDNFELHTTYKKKVRLQNCSKSKRPFFFKYPKKSPFSLQPVSDIEFLAPGMYADFQVTYCAKIYHNYSIDIEFSSSGGYKAVLKVTSFRKPPHLRVYLFRSMKHILQDKCPGTAEFWEKRCTALNDSIDCGHCFIGNYNYLSLLIGNVANKGRFFLLTEDEWISGNVNTIDHTMQFMKDCFQIFPSYIIVEKDEVAEICVTFTPNASGLHVEKLYLISDNNTAKAIEVIGDGLFFSRNMIQIHLKSRNFENVAKIGEKDVLSLEIEGKRRVYLGYIANFSSNKLTFTVNNRSPMSFNFYWIFRRNDEDSNSHFLEPKYIHVINEKHYSLSPYTIHDFDVDVKPEVDQEGHYCVIIGFYIEKIPENALEEGEEFTVRKDKDNIKFLDIQLGELEIGCDIYFEDVIDRPPVKKCACPKPAVCTEVKLKFSTELMDFGVIPIGIKLTRKLSIFKTSNEDIDWFIKEIIYDIDVRPSMYVASNSFIEESKGTLTDKKCGLTYHIDAKKPIRWLSMLLLFSQKSNGEMKMNDMCIVTYEVVDWDIRIFSEVSNFPIVCSLKLHYVGKQYKWHFFIKNYTPIMGCFWLLPPIGEEADRLDLKFQPKFGLIRPGKKVKVVVNVVPKESGIIENIVVPCFISKSCPPIMIRILAAVDDVNVYFYIPSREEGYDKIIWPPKVLNEVDFQQVKSAERLGGEEECDFVYGGESDGNLENSRINFPSAQSYSSDAMQSNQRSDHTIDSHIPTSNSNTPIVSLAEFLQERCSNDFMKHDYVVEVRNVFLNEPSTWKKACGKHGIVIVVDIEKGILNYGDVIQINVWIYAMTWGIYTEEIMVYINNITPFYFNVFVEVKGLPVAFPMARNTIRKYATMRFGHIPYMTDIVTRILHMKNTSCIPLSIQWFLFNAAKKSDETWPFNVILDIINEDIQSSDGNMRLFLSNNNYGKQDINFMEVSPRSIDLAPDEKAFVEVKMNPNNFPVNFEATNLTCYLIGYIFVKEEHKNQPNLFYRTSAEDLKPLHVEIVATIVMPLLKLELIHGQTKIFMHATEIIDGKNHCKRTKLSFQNSNLTSVFVDFHVDAPFSIANISTREYGLVENINNAVIKPGDLVEIELNCSLEVAQIEQMGNWLYNNEPCERAEICAQTKVLTLCRHLNIHQRGVLEQSVPLLCEIYYPIIDVNPTFLKFNHVKIGSTKKLYLQLCNMSNVDIAFDIQTSINIPQFVVKPETGVIPKAVGLTRSFIDVCVYFTPDLYDFYQESIVIRTKISQCYLEVPMNGYGIQNEKFDVDHLAFQP